MEQNKVANSDDKKMQWRRRKKPKERRYYCPPFFLVPHEEPPPSEEPPNAEEKNEEELKAYGRLCDSSCVLPSFNWASKIIDTFAHLDWHVELHGLLDTLTHLNKCAGCLAVQDAVFKKQVRRLLKDRSIRDPKKRKERHLKRMNEQRQAACTKEVSESCSRIGRLIN